MVIAVFLAVLVLGGGGGYAAYYVTTHRTANNGGNGPTASPTAPATTAPAAFDPYAVKVGDCLVNKGTASDPDLTITGCDTAKSFTVLKISKGAAIPEGAGDKFDAGTTSAHECAGTGFESWYGYQDAYNDDRDLFFCLKNN